MADIYENVRNLPFVPRMLEGGVPLSFVASILGWSAATTARMR